MPLYSFEGRSPVVDPSAFVAPTATLIGDVHVEAGASVWFNAVLRADFAPIIIREGAEAKLFFVVARGTVSVRARQSPDDTVVARIRIRTSLDFGSGRATSSMRTTCGGP